MFICLQCVFPHRQVHTFKFTHRLYELYVQCMYIPASIYLDLYT